MRRLDARHAAQQDAAAHLRAFEVLGPLLDAHASGDLAHRRQERQPALVVAERFVGHGNDAGLQQIFGQLAVGGEVKIGEDDLARPQHLEFGRLRLLDLDDHLRTGVNLLGGGDDFGAVAGVLVVAETRSRAGRGLDQHVVPCAGKLLGADGQQADAVFVILDFFGDADEHD